MNVLELKGSIMERVASLQNPSLLEHLDDIIKDFIESDADNWFDDTGNNGFTPEQIEQLLIAEVECDDPNNFISHEEVVKEMEELLNRPRQ